MKERPVWDGALSLTLDCDCDLTYQSQRFSALCTAAHGGLASNRISCFP